MNCCYSTQNVFCFPLKFSSILMFRVVFLFLFIVISTYFQITRTQCAASIYDPSYIHNVHPCLSSSKPFLLVLICLLKVLPDWKVAHWRTMFSARVWQCEFAFWNTQWKEKTDSESCPLASACVQGLCAPVPTHRHHAHTYTKIIMILNM